MSPKPSRLEIYEAILQVALSDGVVHSAEREFLHSFAQQFDITQDEHAAALTKLGWTLAQWSAGAQEAELSGANYIKNAIPELLKQAGVKSRLINAKENIHDLPGEWRGHPDEHPPR